MNCPHPLLHPHNPRIPKHGLHFLGGSPSKKLRFGKYSRLSIAENLQAGVLLTFLEITDVVVSPLPESCLDKDKPTLLECLDTPLLANYTSSDGVEQKVSLDIGHTTEIYNARTCRLKSSGEKSLVVIHRHIKEGCQDQIIDWLKADASEQCSTSVTARSITCPEIDSEVLGLEPATIEDRYVHQVYDKIADHFSNTRYRGWPKVEAFVREKSEAVGSVVVDMGCGNGKYFGATGKESLWIGSDYSNNLLKACLKKHPESHVIRADTMHIPIRSSVADVTISIAVLHHLSTRERRLAAIREMIRITRRGGHILIYVWAKKQTTDSIGARQFQGTDVFVPWTAQQVATEENDLSRFYHVFEDDELRDECVEAIGDLGKIEKIYYDCNNWAVILQKTTSYPDALN